MDSFLGNSLDFSGGDYNNDAAATSGAVSYASPNLTWTGDLAAGASATVTFSVTVNRPYPGSGPLSFKATSATVGTNCRRHHDHAGPLSLAAIPAGNATYVIGSLVSPTGSAVSWDPTISIAVPAGASNGTYSGVITHSVS